MSLVIQFDSDMSLTTQSMVLCVGFETYSTHQVLRSWCLTASMTAFQADGPGSNPGGRSKFQIDVEVESQVVPTDWAFSHENARSPSNETNHRVPSKG